MTNALAALLLFAAPAGAAPAAPPKEVAPSSASITITWPPPNYVMSSAPGEMVLGWVSHPNAPFRINGNPVKPHRLGGFIAYPPISPGTFTFHCELDAPSGPVSATRSIYVTPPLAASPPGPARIDLEARQPASDLELRAGDWALVQMKGTPGGQAEFAVGASKQRHPMTESNAALGLYQGAYQVTLADDFDRAEIEFTLKNDQGSASAKALGRITTRTGPVVAVVKSSGIVSVKTGPGEGYLFFPPYNTKFLVAGRQGSETKLQLSPTQVGWTDTSNLQFLPPGTYPPRGLLTSIATAGRSESTIVSLGLSDTVPFQLEESEDLRTLAVRLYHTTGHLNWIIYDSTDTFVRQIRWRQDEEKTAVVTIHLDPTQRLWGVNAYWVGGALKLELRRPPAFAPKPESVFKGRTIIVDAGHMPSAPGGVGPRGVLEKDVNLAIARELERLVFQEGGLPVMTRAGDDEVGLLQRVRLAWEKRGDLFISVHINNLPDGANPFVKQRGYFVLYYHPHSLDLAKAVHESYRRRIPLADEGLWYGNLLVARMTEMPAILVESAHIVFPEQEALLQSPSFQRRLARAMLEGMRKFLEAQRGRLPSLPKAASFASPEPEPDPSPELEKARGEKAAAPGKDKAKPGRRRKKV